MPLTYAPQSEHLMKNERVSWSINPDDNPQLRELLRSRTSAEFAGWAELLDSAIQILLSDRGQTVRTLAFARILKDAAEELSALSEDSWTRKSIRDMAWATRNLLELVIKYRYVREDDGHLKQMLDEQLRDEIDVYESMKALSYIPGDDVWCDEQIAKVNALAVAGQHQIPKRPAAVADLAKSVGLEDEYRAVFKLYSKWVHPTSWRLFLGGFTQQFIVGIARMVFVGRAKAYAQWLLESALVDSVASSGDVTARSPGPYDQPLPAPDEFEEKLGDTLIDPASVERLRQIREDLKALGVPNPPHDPDAWSKRRLL